MGSVDVVQGTALAGALAAALLLFGLIRLGRGGAAPRPARAAAKADGHRPRAAVVVHALKVTDVDARRRQIETATERLGWAKPRWFDTTELDPGRSQAREALDSGADAVLAFGGDGTARVVAEALCRTGVPLGLLPAGTGNLLARNLGIPPGRLEQALGIALSGRDRPIDVGRAEIDLSGTDPEPVRETFLVMAGVGFDAEVMAAVDPSLKERVGWGAYVVAGLKRLRGRRTPVTIRLDDGPALQRRVRAVVIGNCGTLTAGIPLMPAANVDDGWLDVVIVSPRTVLGWLGVSTSVITRTRNPAVEHARCRSVEIRAERPLHVQLDGDTSGTAKVMRARVDPLALVVRVPDDGRPAAAAAEPVTEPGSEVDAGPGPEPEPEAGSEPGSEAGPEAGAAERRRGGDA
jgi:diacylglycerol kinase (ATP)